MKVLLSSLYFNGPTLGFQPQTPKLEPLLEQNNWYYNLGQNYLRQIENTPVFFSHATA